MAIEEILEIPVAETQKIQKPSAARLERGVILSVIGQLSGKLRIALTALGLLGGGEIGCAHSKLQAWGGSEYSTRSVCIVFTDENEVTEDLTTEKIQTQTADALYRYLHDKYNRISVYKGEEVPINVLLKEKYGSGIQAVNKLPASDASSPEKEIAAITENLTERHPLFIEEMCDDVIGIDVTTSIARTQSIVTLTMVIVNSATNRVIKSNQTVAPLNKKRGQWDIEKLGAEFEEIFEEGFFDGYRPDQLPALSLDQIEKYLFEKIKDLYGKIKNAEGIFPETELTQFNILVHYYNFLFPHYSNPLYPGSTIPFPKYQRFYLDIHEVSKMQKDIEEFPTEYAKREKILEEKQREQKIKELREGPAVRELRELLAQAKTAEDRGAYEEAAGLFHAARQAGYTVKNAYQQAGIPIPWDIDKLGIEISEGLRNNEDRIGIIRPPSPQRSPDASDVFMAGAGMIKDTVVAAITSPEFGVILEKLAEVNAKLRQDLAKEGITADLTIILEKDEFLINRPIENVEITMKQKDPPYSTRTFRTTKEGIIESGGKARFFLKPGQYEISCPIFRETYTVTVREGQNYLRIELQ